MTTPLVQHIVRPIMRAWAARCEAKLAKVPRPTGPFRSQSSGPDPVRLLLIGSGPAVGFGSLTQELALPGHLARQLSPLLGRGVDVDVMVDPGMTAGAAVDALERTRLTAYDAVFAVLGATEAMSLGSEKAWRTDVAALLDLLADAGPTDMCTFVATVPVLPDLPIFTRSPLAKLADAHGRRLGAALAELVSRREGVRIIPFPKDECLDGQYYRASDSYRRCAARLAPVIADALRAATCESSHVDDDVDEEIRHRSLAELDILDTPREERFTRIAEMARQLFGTSAAALTFLDGDRQWFKAGAGIALEQTPRSIAFCDTTIRSGRAFVVPDTLLDARFASNPFVTGAEGVRFYAGFPIESSGVRVGSLCVLDTSPREFTAADEVLLRDLAMLVQRELRPSREELVLR